MKRRLTTIVETLADDSAVRVVILTGAQGVFVAGTDVAEMAHMTPTEHTLPATDQVFTVLRRFPKILIAAVEGYALGGGCGDPSGVLARVQREWDFDGTGKRVDVADVAQEDLDRSPGLELEGLVHGQAHVPVA